MQKLHYTVKHSHTLTTTTATATTIITYIKITIYLFKSKAFLHNTSRDQRNSPKKSEYFQGHKWDCALHIYLVQTKCFSVTCPAEDHKVKFKAPLYLWTSSQQRFGKEQYSFLTSSKRIWCTFTALSTAIKRNIHRYSTLTPHIIHTHIHILTHISMSLLNDI